MSDNFSANAELGFDVSEFLSGGKNVEAVLERIEKNTAEAAASLDKMQGSFSAAGKAAKQAATDMRSADARIASDQRDTIRLRKMYEDEFRASQRDNIRLTAMYEKDAAAQAAAASRARIAIQKDETAQKRAAHKSEMAAWDAEFAALNRNAKAAQAAANATTAAYNKEQANLSRARYALYDVSTVFTAVSAATLGVVTGINAVGIAFEKNFASVARTSGLSVQSDLQALRDDLVDLSKNIPVDFANIASIGTLAGQLGVAAEDIAKFTEVVSMFSASTNVSVEKSAEDIGRVAQLTGTAGDEYENLASSIYQVGVTSVATESAILETATNIATAGDLAGFTAAEVVALSGAFASLGVAPERARGTVQRVFGEITEAVSSGGKALTAFSDVSGMTATDFAATWKSAPQEAFNALIQGLGAAHSAGVDTNAMLKDLGINAVRDIQALQVLANNFNVYADAQKEANNGFVSGTALSEGYAITAETTAAKIGTLVNQIKALFDELSNSELVGVFAESLQNALKVIDALVSIPGADWLITFAGGVTALIGAFALYNAIVARATASAYANRTAMATMADAGESVRLGFRGMVGEMLKMVSTLTMLDQNSRKAGLGLTTVGTSAQTAAAQVATANTAIASSSAKAGASVTAIGTTARTAATGVSALGSAGMGLLRFAGPIAGWAAAFKLLEVTITGVSRAMESTEGRAKRVYGDLSSLSSAIQADTEEWKKHNEQVKNGEKVTNEAAGSYNTFTGSVETNERSLTDNAKAVEAVLGVSVQHKDSTTELTKEITGQTVALGENAKMWLYNQYAQGDNLDTMVDYIERLKTFQGQIKGFNIQQMLNAALDPASGGAAGYVKKFSADVEAQYQAAVDKVAQLTSLVQAGDASRGVDLAKAQAEESALSGTRDLIADLANTAKDMDSAFVGATSRMEAQRVVAKSLGVDLEDLGDGANSAGDDVTTLAEQMKGLSGAASGIVDVEEAMYALGGSIAENGGAFDAFSEAGRANLASVQKAMSAMAEAAGDDTQALAYNLVNMLDNLQGAGVGASEELGFAYDALFNLVGLKPAELSFDSSAARNDIRKFISDAIAALETRAALERENAPKALGISPSASAEQWKAYNEQVNNAGVASQKQADALKGLLNALDKQGNAANRTKSFNEGYNKSLNNGRAANDRATKAAEKNKKAVEDQAKAVRTYADYASDLSNVLKRSFELRFGNEIAADNTLDARIGVEDVYKKQNDLIQEQRDKIVDLNKSVRDYDNTIKDLNADLAGLRAGNTLLEYQLGIARKYGNKIAEESILAEMAKNNAEIAKTEADITDAQNDRNKASADIIKTTDALNEAIRALNGGMGGNTQFARDLRDAYRDLVSAQQDELVQAAKNGASQGTLKRLAGEHKDQIKDLRKTYRESPADFAAFIGAVNDSKRTLDTVPKNVTVTLKYKKDGSVDTVGTAFRELKSKTVEAQVRARKDPSVDAARKAYDGLRNKTATVTLNTNSNLTGRKAAQRALDAALAAQKKAYLDQPKGGTVVDYWDAKVNKARKALDNYWVGGFTGRGGKYEEAGTVHRGEIVIPQEHVNQRTGMPNMSALGFLFKGMSMPPKSNGSSQASSNAIQLVEILPNQLARLEKAMSVLVNLDLESLTSGVNRVNEQNNMRGSR